MSGFDAAAGVAGLVAKATVVLCLALALAWLARRGSARTLHLFWTTTFVLLLALPVLSLLGPSWPVSILPARDIAAEGASPREVGGRSSDSGCSATDGRASGFVRALATGRRRQDFIGVPDGRIEPARAAGRRCPRPADPLHHRLPDLGSGAVARH